MLIDVHVFTSFEAWCKRNGKTIYLCIGHVTHEHKNKRIHEGCNLNPVQPCLPELYNQHRSG